MRAVIQRTQTEAKVIVASETKGIIDKGLVIYLGVGKEDDEEDLLWIANKVVQLRIFSDEHGKMNKSVQDIGGGLLVISQFTLFASTKKGNRPSYMNSGPPEEANRLYEAFLLHLRENYDLVVQSGVFGADMQVSYTNNGPVTIIIDSKNRE